MTLWVGGASEAFRLALLRSEDRHPLEGRFQRHQPEAAVLHGAADRPLGPRENQLPGPKRLQDGSRRGCAWSKSRGSLRRRVPGVVPRFTATVSMPGTRSLASLVKATFARSRRSPARPVRWRRAPLRRIPRPGRPLMLRLEADASCRCGPGGRTRCAAFGVLADLGRKGRSPLHAERIGRGHQFGQFARCVEQLGVDRAPAVAVGHEELGRARRGRIPRWPRSPRG